MPNSNRNRNIEKENDKGDHRLKTIRIKPLQKIAGTRHPTPPKYR
jgi:hypothetical protein